jgi:nucleotidyltransferase substrate binding protein (TIGR01987 family)
MSEAKLARATVNFERALTALEATLAEDTGDRRSRDSVILNFLLAYETCWKALKQALAAEGIQAAYPKEVFRRAFEAGWLSAEAPWLAMLEDRNLIAHTYNERTAERVRAGVGAALQAFREVRDLLARRRS